MRSSAADGATAQAGGGQTCNDLLNLRIAFSRVSELFPHSQW